MMFLIKGYIIEHFVKQFMNIRSGAVLFPPPIIICFQTSRIFNDANTFSLLLLFGWDI